jgi:hypothetical protein
VETLRYVKTHLANAGVHAEPVEDGVDGPALDCDPLGLRWTQRDTIIPVEGKAQNGGPRARTGPG